MCHVASKKFEIFRKGSGPLHLYLFLLCPRKIDYLPQGSSLCRIELGRPPLQWLDWALSSADLVCWAKFLGLSLGAKIIPNNCPLTVELDVSSAACVEEPG